MTHGSLFSGIGGFDLSFQRVGIDTLWMVENDAACQLVLRRHFLDAELYHDVCRVSGRYLAPVDIITFGSPCQDLSIAGKRAGMEGARSGLFFEAIRIIREMREATNGQYPTYAIWENVPGALSSAKGSDFTGVLDALANIGALDIAWRVLNAEYFGVPQRRRRVYVVADFAGQRAGEILFESEGVCRDIETRKKTRQVAPDLPASGAGTSRTGNERTEAGFLISMALNAKSTGRYDASVETLITSPLTTDAYADQVAEESKLIPVCFDARNNAVSDNAPTLQSKESGGYSLNAMPLCFESIETLKPLWYNTYYGGLTNASTQKRDAGEILRVLREEIGAKAFTLWGLGIIDSLQPEEILRPGVYGEGIWAASSPRCGQVNGALCGTSNCPERSLFDLWEAGCQRRTPPGRKLLKQFARELATYLSWMSQQETPTGVALCDLWDSSKGLRILRQALSAIQENRKPVNGKDSTKEEMCFMWRYGERERIMRQALYASEEEWQLAKELDSVCDRKRGLGVMTVRRLTPLPWNANDCKDSRTILQRRG